MEEKYCYTCCLMKPIDMFPVRGTKVIGMCLACYVPVHGAPDIVAAKQKAKLKLVQKEKDKIRVQKCRVAIKELLCKSKCKVCGVDDWEVLEFDHRDPATKHKAICTLVADGSYRAMLVEIAKCDILCANCHRKKTMRQFGYWKTTIG